MVVFIPITEDGFSNFPVSLEKEENKTEILSNLMPPAVVANPPPNKHSPSKITEICGKTCED